MTYSELGANISRSILADHPEVWYWQPFSMQMVSKQHAKLDLVIKQTNLLVFRNLGPFFCCIFWPAFGVHFNQCLVALHSKLWLKSPFSFFSHFARFWCKNEVKISIFCHILKHWWHKNACLAPLKTVKNKFSQAKNYKKGFTTMDKKWRKKVHNFMILPVFRKLSVLKHVILPVS